MVLVERKKETEQSVQKKQIINKSPSGFSCCNCNACLFCVFLCFCFFLVYFMSFRRLLLFLLWFGFFRINITNLAVFNGSDLHSHYCEWTVSFTCHWPAARSSWSGLGIFSAKRVSYYALLGPSKWNVKQTVKLTSTKIIASNKICDTSALFIYNGEVWEARTRTWHQFGPYWVTELSLWIAAEVNRFTRLKDPNLNTSFSGTWQPINW